MASENNAGLLKRLWIYQRERFPVFGHGIMIMAFTFSAVSYSISCREGDAFIPLSDYFIGVFLTVSLFLLVRIFDEFKDNEDDLKYRQYLPVPRGLVTLKELGRLGRMVVGLQLMVLIAFQPRMLLLYAAVMVYLLLMRVEFFRPKWLKEHHMIYILSHMLIIPLIDLYASGLDWLLGDIGPHYGLLWFFAVSYCNGLVLEFGRKLRTPEREEEGVMSYTKYFGMQKGVWVYILSMFTTMLLAIGAAYYAQDGERALPVFIITFVICSASGFLFLRKPSEKLIKPLEYSAALWTILMYAFLGAMPMINTWLS